MQRIARWLWHSIDVVTAVLLAAMIALVFTNVVMRYGFATGIRVSVELSRLAFVWVVMLGSVAALWRGQHIGVPEFAERFFPRWLPVLNAFTWLTVIVTSAMLVVGCWQLTLSNWGNVSPLTGLPTGLFFLAGVVAGAMMVAIGIYRLFRPAPSGVSRSEEGV